MTSLAEAALTESERRVLDRLVQFLQAEFGEHLRSVWLYGSRARGERPGPESDIDLLAVVDGELFDNIRRVVRLEVEAAAAEGTNAALVSTHVYSPERLAQRREIRSFFIQEVDRDRIVLYGQP